MVKEGILVWGIIKYLGIGMNTKYGYGKVGRLGGWGGGEGRLEEV